jgi:putative phosphoesterase
MIIGVIADTHGLLRREVLELFTGVSLIIHAGDIGTPDVLTTLREIAPVRAVRGNVDKGAWADSLPETEVVEYNGSFIYLLHDLKTLDLDPSAAGIQVVISGHSHRPEESRKNGVLYLNPGSAGPRRFKLPVTAALLRIEESGKITWKVHEI